MSRRRQSPELEFGSDSFLDVIANIVGILIILIVIVGMKVARQPLENSVAAVPAAEVIEKTTNTEQTTQLQRRQQLLDQITELGNLQQLAMQLEAELERWLSNAVTLEGTIQEETGDRELLRLQLVSASQQLERTKQREKSIADHHKAMTAALEVLRGQIGENKALLDQTSRANAAATAQSELIEKAIQVTGFETQQLAELLEQATQPSENAPRLRHRLQPVGQKVEEGELHFRVADNRISHVPLEELIERLKTQILNRRSTVIRMPKYEGMVGPISGYRMNYVVERANLSPLESLQYNGGIRVGVSRWTIEPDIEIPSETIGDAIRPGSRFRQLVETARPGSAVTLWIYPDSFAGFSALREVAHGLQLQVAARPLPQGIPITGSPGGSQSTAQ